MEIKTEEGLDVFVLPECARCRLTGENPMDMDCCPISKVDDFGDVCMPEMCDEYQEGD